MDIRKVKKLIELLEESNIGEIEIKGESARNLWADMHKELLATEQLGTSRGATLHSFSKASLRAYLPIRDCSRWFKKPLPRNWAQMAAEPTTWANLFDADPITVKPRERRMSSLLKSYRYANANFGSALSLMAAQRYLVNRDAGMSEHEAAEDAFIRGMDDATLGANEDRIRDFCSEIGGKEGDRLLEQWFAFLQKAASNQEAVRD